MKGMLELISRYLDHTLTPVEVGELGQWIKADPANARRFVEEAYIHSRMRDLLVGEQFLRNHQDREPKSRLAAPSPQDKRTPKARSPQKKTRLALPWLIAASLVLIPSLAATLWWNGKSGQNS